MYLGIVIKTIMRIKLKTPLVLYQGGVFNVV